MARFRFCPRCGAPLSVPPAPAEAAAGPATASTDITGEGPPRATCTGGCGFVHYDNPVPVVAAVIEHDGLVLLARNRAWPETWYALVAGFLERGEAPDEAVRREVKEEVGLDATSTALIGVYPFAKMNQVIIAYHVVATGPIALNGELVDYRRIEPARCGSWWAGTGLALRDWLLARGFDPRMTDLPG